MLVVYDYTCHRCGAAEERMVKKSEKDNQRHGCCPDDPLMRRWPAGTRTTFKFADTKLKR